MLTPKYYKNIVKHLSNIHEGFCALQYLSNKSIIYKLRNKHHLFTEFVIGRRFHISFEFYYRTDSYSVF